MEITDALGFGSSNLCTWSPNGRFLAVVSSKCRLVLRDAATLDVLRTEVIVSNSNGDDNVNVVLFSPDSEFVLASDFNNGTTFVYKVGTDKESCTWKAKIGEGLSGIIDIKWSPDSRHIITMAEFNVKLTVWSLIQRMVRYIKFPKKKECVQFSPDGTYLAVVERRDNKDCVSLFSAAKDWGVAKHFELTSDMDSGGIKWSPMSNYIVVFSSKLQCIATVHSLDGRCLFYFKPQDIGVSLTSVSFSHCGNILAIATSQGISICNCLTWSVISNLDIPTVIDEYDHQNAVAYIEMEKPLTNQNVDVRIARELSRSSVEMEYVPAKGRPLELLSSKTSFYKCAPNVEVEFSPDSKYLMATSNSNHICWVWQVTKLQLHSVMLHQRPILSTLWSPQKETITSLMILTNDGGLHVWTSHGVICISLPLLDKDYGKIKEIRWNPLGRAFAITLSDGVVCCRVGRKSS